MLAIYISSHISDKYFDLYGKIAWFDIMMHTIGGFATAVVVDGLWSAWRLYGPRVGRAFWIISGVMLVAVVWEWHEYAMDQWVYGKTHMQPSIQDTMGDLLMGMIGALLYIATWMRRKMF